MPRIRKKTSNRASTNDRAKVRHKVKETKKKKAKAAKKNPQWKSRKPKDPGIPNEFPYKDQILAEVAEQRRMAAEEKEQRKAEKKARAEEATSNGKIKKDLNVGADSIASLSAKLIKGELKPRPQPIPEQEMDVEEEDDVPVLINRDLPTLQSVLEKADVVLEVVDARDPMAFRSGHVEQLVKDSGKKMLLVLNKIDACPREALAAWTGHLRTQCPTLMFRSATAFLPEGPMMQDPLVKKVKGKGKAKIPIDDALGAGSLINYLSQWAKEKKGREALSVAVVGVANVGKSSLINSLLKRAALPTYTLASSSRGPSTTEIPQEVTLEVDSQKIVLIDTPGLSFISDAEADASTLEEFRARDILLRSKGRIDRLKDPRPPVSHIVTRANTEDLMLLYSLPAFTKGDSSAFLSCVARANQLVKKKGELDLAGAARIVLRDWSLGKFTRYTTPPVLSVNAVAPQPSITAKLTNSDDSSATQLYADDETILSAILTRKERRKQGGGLVKFASGTIDPRKAAVEEPWDGLQLNDDSEESDDDDEVGVDIEGMDVDSEDDDDENDEEDETEAEDSQGDEEDAEEDAEDADDEPRKQKRKRGPERAPPAKKVAFSDMPPARGSTSDRSKIEAKKKDREGSMKTAQSKSKAVRDKTSEKRGRIANITMKRIDPVGTPSGPEVYDFGKFF